MISASTKLQFLFATAFFCQVGTELTAASWLPSYAVITHTFDEKQAAFCGTIFWIMFTIFRFVVAALKIECSKKLSFLTKCIIFCSLVNAFLTLQGMHKAATLFGSVGFGTSCSGGYSLLLSVPMEFGIKLTPEQLSTILLVPAFSLMVVTTSVGMLMRISANMLMVCLVVMSCALGTNVYFLFRQMKEESMELGADVELREMIVK